MRHRSTEKISFALFLLSIISPTLFYPLSITNAQGLTYEIGDYFIVDISTSLDGSTGDYAGYTEQEHEVRRYEVVDVTGNRVTFKYDRTWEYSDSDGGSQVVKETRTFVIDANTRQYLDNTRDGDPQYYKFDYTWIRMDPSATVGSGLTILGHQFIVKGKTILYPDLFTAIEVIEVNLRSPYQQTVNNDDYDPDGELSVVVSEEKYYFDPKTGYLVWSTWKAQGITSVGNFQWSETIRITEASFPIPYRQDLIFQRYLFIAILIALILMGTMGFIHFRRRRHVSTTIAMLESRKSFPVETSDDKVTSWSAVPISYQLLLNIDSASADRRTLGLTDGIFIVISTDGKLGVVDTKKERKLESILITRNRSSLIALYKLALGNAPNDSNELLPLLNSIPELNDRLKFTVIFAEPDNEIMLALSRERVNLRDTTLNQKDFDEVARLLSRRKVLDYSYGQAPLTVQSHLRKTEMVFKYKPERVLLVGDDDLLSITLARHGIKVTTIEIDAYTCALIHGIAQEENLPIHLYQVDLRDPLPPDIPNDFDVFVADPEFTIESFALFLARGLSKIKEGGIGLINYENKRGQRYKATKILEYVGVEVIEILKEPWNYVVVRNEKIPIRSYYGYGKSAIVDYKQDFIVAVARFSSIMFVIKRTPNTKILLDSDSPLAAPSSVIYDYDD